MRLSASDARSKRALCSAADNNNGAEAIQFTRAAKGGQGGHACGRAAARGTQEGGAPLERASQPRACLLDVAAGRAQKAQQGRVGEEVALRLCEGCTRIEGGAQSRKAGIARC